MPGCPARNATISSRLTCPALTTPVSANAVRNQTPTGPMSVSELRADGGFPAPPPGFPDPRPSSGASGSGRERTSPSRAASPLVTAQAKDMRQKTSAGNSHLSLSSAPRLHRAALLLAADKDRVLAQQGQPSRLFRGLCIADSFPSDPRLRAGAGTAASFLSSQDSSARPALLSLCSSDIQDL